MTGPYMLGRVDGDLLRSAPASAQTVLILGDYRWDGNPYIGTWLDTVLASLCIKDHCKGSMANIHVWDRTMEEEELRQKTSCSQTVEDQGSLVNHRCVDIIGYNI